MPGKIYRAFPLENFMKRKQKIEGKQDVEVEGEEEED
jgi:hypothetical protein